MQSFYHLFVGLVIALTILSAFGVAGPRWANYGYYGYVLVAVLAVCTGLRVFFGV